MRIHKKENLTPIQSLHQYWLRFTNLLCQYLHRLQEHKISLCSTSFEFSHMSSLNSTPRKKNLKTSWDNILVSKSWDKKGAVIWNPATSYDEMTSFCNSSVWCPNWQYFLAQMPYVLAPMLYFKFKKFKICWFRKTNSKKCQWKKLFSIQTLADHYFVGRNFVRWNCKNGYHILKATKTDFVIRKGNKHNTKRADQAVVQSPIHVPLHHWACWQVGRRSF